nr:PREDICTED: uncharacterized protein LOC109434618 [Rhinolophus sinicus]
MHILHAADSRQRPGLSAHFENTSEAFLRLRKGWGRGHEPWKAGGTCPACGMWVSPSGGFWPLLADPPFRPCRVAYRQALPRTKGSQTCRPPTDLSQHGQHHCTGQHLMERGFCPPGRPQESGRGTDSPSPPTGVSQQRLGSIGPAGSSALSKASRGGPAAELPLRNVEVTRCGSGRQHHTPGGANRLPPSSCKVGSLTTRHSLHRWTLEAREWGGGHPWSCPVLWRPAHILLTWSDVESCVGGPHSSASVLATENLPSCKPGHRPCWTSAAPCFQDQGSAPYHVPALPGATALHQASQWLPHPDADLTFQQGLEP